MGYQIRMGRPIAHKQVDPPGQLQTSPAPGGFIVSREFITERELVRRIPAISLATWQTWRARRKGPPWHKAGGRVLYVWQDVEAWLDSVRVEPVNDKAAAVHA